MAAFTYSAETSTTTLYIMLSQSCTSKMQYSFLRIVMAYIRTLNLSLNTSLFLSLLDFLAPVIHGFMNPLSIISSAVLRLTSGQLLGRRARPRGRMASCCHPVAPSLPNAAGRGTKGRACHANECQRSALHPHTLCLALGPRKSA